MTTSPVIDAEGPQSYQHVTAANDAVRERLGWNVVDLDAAITPALRADYERWRLRQRVAWGLDDVVAVACAGLVALGAIWFDAPSTAACVLGWLVSPTPPAPGRGPGPVTVVPASGRGRSPGR